MCNDTLACRAVRYAGDADLLDRRVLIERRFHLKRRDQLPALPDHLRFAAEKPVIIIIVAARQTAALAAVFRNVAVEQGLALVVVAAAALLGTLAPTFAGRSTI